MEMVGDIFQPTHLLFVLVVALLVLGPKRLPEVGRTLGSGIRDFRQALSGEAPDPPQHQASEQVATTTTELRHQPENTPDVAADVDFQWPEAAIGPTSFDEPVQAASAEPATMVVNEPEPATAVVTEPEPTALREAFSTGQTAAQADAPYFQEPVDEADPIAGTSGSPESHTDQSS